jgi:hypothetical protein
MINTFAAKYLYWSIFKKSRHLGFGVFIYIWSMGRRTGIQGAPRGGKGCRTIQDVVAGRSVVAVGETVVPGDVVRKPLDE